MAEPEFPSTESQQPSPNGTVSRDSPFAARDDEGQPTTRTGAHEASGQMSGSVVPRAIVVGSRVGMLAIIATVLALLVGTAYPAINDSAQQDPGEQLMEVALFVLLGAGMLLGAIAIVLGLRHKGHPLARYAIMRGWLALLVALGSSVIALGYMSFAGTMQ